MSNSIGKREEKVAGLFEHEQKFRLLNYYLTDVLDGECSENGELNLLVNAIRMMSEDDVINIYINSPGGALHKTIQLINAMNECSGKVVTIIDGNCFSAATLVFLSGDELVLNENITMMFHYYSVGIVGKGGDVEKYMEHIQTFNKELFSSLYEGFLTKDELRRLFAGEDFWFKFDEIARRLNNRNEYLTKKMSRDGRSKKRKVSKNAG